VNSPARAAQQRHGQGGQQQPPQVQGGQPQPPQAQDQQQRGGQVQPQGDEACVVFLI
jgi:hypothetical protein